MKKFFKKLIGSAIVTSCLLIILGVLFIIYPEELLSILCYAIGAVVLIYGLILILRQIRDESAEITFGGRMIMGIFMCGVGIFFFIAPLVAQILSIAFGLFLIIDGIVNLQKSIELKKMRYDYWWTDLILALLSVIAGVVLIVNFSDIPGQVFGICLLYDEVMNLISAYGLNRAEKLNSKLYIEKVSEEDIDEASEE